MEGILHQQVDYIFPTKSVRVFSQDLPYITGDIKKLDKYIKKKYKMKVKSDKYLKVKKAYDNKMKKAASKHLKKYVTDIMEEAPGKAYQNVVK